MPGHLSKSEIALRVWEAPLQGKVDDVADLVDPAAEFHTLPMVTGPAVYRGLDGLRKLAAQTAGPDLRITSSLEKVEENGSRVLILAKGSVQHGEGRGFGTQVGAVFHVEDGCVLRMDTFPTWAEAERAFE